MFTIYDSRTGEKVRNVSGRTEDIAYARAERFCERTSALVFDDTCHHLTAYSICASCAAEQVPA